MPHEPRLEVDRFVGVSGIQVVADLFGGAELHVVDLTGEAGSGSLKDEDGLVGKIVGPGVVVDQVPDIAPDLVKVGLLWERLRLELENDEGAARQHDNIGSAAALEGKLVLEHDPPPRASSGSARQDSLRAEAIVSYSDCHAATCDSDGP